MCNTWLVSISLVRQHVVQEVRVLCRVSLCCCSSYMLFTDFLLLWWVVHRPRPHGSMRTERGSSLPWHGSTMGLSTFGAIPALAWSTTLLMCFLCCSQQCLLWSIPFVASCLSPIFLPQYVWEGAPCILVEILACSGWFPSVWEPSGTGCDLLRAVHGLLLHWSHLEPSGIKTLQWTLSTPPSVP